MKTDFIGTVFMQKKASRLSIAYWNYERRFFMKVGYVRVSTAEQNTARQEVLMKQLGVEKVYIDKISGKSADRPQLREMLTFVRNGDTVMVEAISRFARNTKDLLELIDVLQKKGVEFVSQKEKIDTSTPTGRFMLTVFAAVAELERAYLLDRQKEGIAVAKSQGKYKGRKPITVDEQLWAELFPLWKKGEISATEFMRRIGISKSTFYRKIHTDKQNSA